jgi:hypothetical protein
MCALIALLAATFNDTKATVLYVRVTPQEIVIGADSKRTAETGATVCVCKITRVDDTFVASAGLAEFWSIRSKRDCGTGHQKLVNAC